MALADKRVWMGVVRDEASKTSADLVLCERSGDHRHILPGAAHAKLGVHAKAHLGNDVFRTRGFVTAAHAAGDVGVEAGFGLRQGIVAGDNFVSGEGGVNDTVRVVIGSKNAWEVHHFAKTDNLIPLHGAGDVFRSDEAAGVFKTRHSRHAGRGHEHALEWCTLAVFDYALYAIKAEDIADLVRIGINTDPHEICNVGRQLWRIRRPRA